MAQVEVFTIIETNTPSFSHTTYYLNPDLGAILLAFITEIGVTEYNGIPMEQGYGVIVLDDDFVEPVTITLDVDGSLLIMGEDTEVTKYAINANGELTYTTTI